MTYQTNFSFEEAYEPCHQPDQEDDENMSLRTLILCVNLVSVTIFENKVYVNKICTYCVNEYAISDLLNGILANEIVN